MLQTGKTLDEIANELSSLVKELVDVGRKDLLLRAIGVPLLEELRIEAAKARLSRLLITKDYRFLLIDYDNKEVVMNPVHKAVYLLFLSHPEGIVLKCLPDYRKELKALYLLLRPYGLTNRVMQSIEDVTNPTLNSINEKCARIRKAFAELLPKSVARFYSISGKRGEIKKVDLVRANVVWKCELPNPQAL